MQGEFSSAETEPTRGFGFKQRWRHACSAAPVWLSVVCTAPDHDPSKLAFAVPQDGGWALGSA